MTGELMANIGGHVLTIDQALEVERAGVSRSSCQWRIRNFM